MPLAEAVQDKAQKLHLDLELARTRLKGSEERLSRAVEAYSEQRKQLDAIRDELDAAKRNVRRIQKQLPSETYAEEIDYDNRIETFRREVLAFRAERDQAEDDISSLLSDLSEATVKIRSDLESIFARRAKAFFAEGVRLVYDPRRERIGQGGRTFEFPAFEVELTSGSAVGEYIRRDEDDVSLSQREYIDLIFRMSLVEALGENNAGTFVVDGPEGSVDAVFARRAGELFSGVAASGSAMSVILACNVVAGDFIPYTLKNFRTTKAREDRTVNLMHLAAPTAALSNLRADYDSAVDEILGRTV
ncbi:hypothetical protein DLJ53_21765 [Acuticoccus sediminis]|uniref:Uncharacterized protein n=2 Tax=Acuticoccus sediminis TaxID=2184697 RepID=A0A8B2NMR7_9HYPH|nr:hypothetical protein DLJ53_21765 [Acuticoccus sediminis]